MSEPNFSVLLFSLIFPIILISLPLSRTEKTPQEIERALRRQRLFPHIIKSIPTHIVEVSYGKHKVDFGNTLTAPIVSEPPDYIKWPTEPEAYYTLALIGPDAANLTRAECTYEHWLVGNILGNDIKDGEELSEYVGFSNEAYDTGFHRLVFLIFLQADGEAMSFSGARLNKTDFGVNRELLCLDGFARHYGLKNPVAINFFECEFNRTENHKALENQKTV